MLGNILNFLFKPVVSNLGVIAYLIVDGLNQYFDFGVWQILGLGIVYFIIRGMIFSYYKMRVITIVKSETSEKVTEE